MGLYPENRQSAYWSQDPNTPNHPITQYMSVDRWQAIYTRIQISDPIGDKNVFQRVGAIPLPFSIILTFLNFSLSLLTLIFKLYPFNYGPQASRLL